MTYTRLTQLLEGYSRYAGQILADHLYLAEAYTGAYNSLWQSFSDHALFMCRYSVNVFRPPFQSGRTSPEASLSRADHPPTTGSIAEGPGTEEEDLHAVEEGDTQEQGNASAEIAPAQASAHSAKDLNSLSTHTTDSGFSELQPCSQDPFGEKETSCEKAVKPEGIFVY